MDSFDTPIFAEGGILWSLATSCLFRSCLVAGITHTSPNFAPGELIQWGLDHWINDSLLTV